MLNGLTAKNKGGLEKLDENWQALLRLLTTDYSARCEVKALNFCLKQENRA